MRRRRTILFLIVAVALVTTSITAPSSTRRAQAQSAITLVLSIPSLWENTITPDLLAAFEAENPGVTVVTTTNETSFFGFGPGLSDTAIEDRLDDTEELVTSADVLYIDSSSLTAEDTQAGYFLDLSPLVMNDPALDTADFIPAVWQSYQWDNGIWALPLSTDVILLTYDPAAFDAVGLAYPNEHWTIDDFATAARALTVYNADGTVATPGFSTVSGGNNQSIFLQTVAGIRLYDAATMPNAPLLAQPALEYTLQVWYELIQEGVVAAQGGGLDEGVPLRVEGINGYSERGFRLNDDSSEQTVRYASLLPGGVAGLSVQGFAVSAGTVYPELSYALAKFLTARSELTSNPFSASPARYSLVNATSQQLTPDPAAPVGPGSFIIIMSNTVPDDIKPTFEQGLTVGLSTAEQRYTSYLSSVVTEMSSSGGDAMSALQTVEATAISNVQTAQARSGTVSLYVNPPAPEPTLIPGKIELTCAVNLGVGGGRGPGGQFFNQDQWDQFIANFTASDPDVGLVTLESVMESDLTTLAETYDCIILPSNVVADSDLSTILSLDPLIDMDTSFDRGDVIGNTLAQLQQDNKTWALPLAIEPHMLEYDAAQFQQAGVPEPINGWTTDAFVDALHMLKPYSTDPAPFQPQDFSGSAILMLIAAFGGLPIDYRTDPPTLNYTDPATVEAIQQVLDLVVDGYIASGSDIVRLDGPTPAITTNSLNQFRRMGPPDAEGSAQDTTVTTTYPQGSQYATIAYSITTGYISATAENPEAAYRFLSQVARSPQLFSGMPVRQSLLNDPAVMAAQGEETVALYQQLDALMRSPNTIVFPTIGGMGGMRAINFMQEHWLRQVLEDFVANGGDLTTMLAEAEMTTQAYMECTANIVVDTAAVTDAFEQQRQVAEQVMACATTVDPSFSLGD